MKKGLFLMVMFLSSMTFVSGQKGSLTLKINKDSLYKDEIIIVEFLLDNLTGNFIPPDFNGFQMVNGPNTSSSFSMINGEVKQTKSFSFGLLPLATGVLEVGVASVENEGDILSTEPVEIFVEDRRSGRRLGNARQKVFIYDSFGVKSDNQEVIKKKKRVLKKI